MILLSCHDITFSVGVDQILSGVSLELQDHEHAALIGVNGAGKSTLFRIIMGQYRPDGGEVFCSRELSVGYLEQNALFESEKTLREEALGVFAEVIKKERELADCEHRLQIEKDVQILSDLSQKFTQLTEQFQQMGGYEYQKRIDGILRGMGFSEEEFEKPVRALSGGQKTRLALAKLLLKEPDILLLDEPTNHLDIATLTWLEGFLKNYQKAFLVVSHDRYFLDAVTTKTIELENGAAKTYPCPYTEYAARKKTEREIERRHYENQQREIARQEAIIEQQRRFNRERNIIAAESRQKAIDRMVKLNAPTKLPGKMRLSFETAVLSGTDVMEICDLKKDFPDKTLFSHISFTLTRGQRTFLLGDNGVGKSTLFKMIEGRVEKTAGQVHLGANVSVGYYDQELSDLNEENTVIDEVWNEAPQATETEIRNLLSAFLFCEDDVFKSLSVLSGGEKARVALCKLLIHKPNLLLLDEPTNHLDIHSREVLEDALCDYDGTIFAISHDRYFINKIANRILHMTTAGLFDFAGNYEEFLAYTAAHPVALPAQNTAEQEAAEAVNEGKLTYQQEKQQQAARRKRERDLQKAEVAIEEAENRLQALEDQMAAPETACDAAKLLTLSEQKEETERFLAEQYELWESLSE